MLEEIESCCDSLGDVGTRWERLKHVATGWDIEGWVRFRWDGLS
jgi:hypothetical protein